MMNIPCLRVGLSAALMYAFGPERGKRRRTRLRDNEIEVTADQGRMRSLPAKLKSVLVASKYGDVVMIFPEGEIH
jgi:hypothetical protein